MNRQERGESSGFWPNNHGEDRDHEGDQLPIREIIVKVVIDSYEEFERSWGTSSQDFDYILEHVLPAVVKDVQSSLLEFGQKYTEGVLHADKLWQWWKAELEDIAVAAVSAQPDLIRTIQDSGLLDNLALLISSIQLKTVQHAFAQTQVARDNPYAWPHHIARGEINWELDRVRNEVKRATDDLHWHIRREREMKAGEALKKSVITCPTCSETAHFNRESVMGPIYRCESGHESAKEGEKIVALPASRWRK